MHIVVALEPGNFKCSKHTCFANVGWQKLEKLWLVPVNNENSWIHSTTKESA